MSAGRFVCLDGNEAAAKVAYLLSEVIAIYPITPASAMGELSDSWSAASRPNLWGAVPRVIEMQSEAGAAGAVHGALQLGSLSTTFTASQGLLLMLPNMFKIAGELTPMVIHVAARSVATHALSIFGDQSDVMAARSTGFAMLASSSVQEAQDLALVAHAATLEGRVPFVHFFDGFRTSHEVDRIEELTADDLRELIDPAHIAAYRARRLTPDRPVLRGSAQNPDVFFQAREACAPFYAALPRIVQGKMDALAKHTGRAYHLVDYFGEEEAEHVMVIMGSGAGACQEAVEALNAAGERVGVMLVRLFRPFPEEAFLEALPESVRSVAVLDRTKEPGAAGEPLYQDVMSVLGRSVLEGRHGPGRVIGGRYGLSSKEFTPAMAKAVFDELQAEEPRRSFTVGIVDDVSGSSLEVDPEFVTDNAEVRAVAFGLGSDGTVGASKATVKIVGELTGLYAQGYFVYDSKKSGSVTVSHLRFSKDPIRSTYLIDSADLLSCGQFGLLQRIDVLRIARPGGTFLLNSPFGPDDVWARLPVEVQQAIIDKKLRFYVVDADRVAQEVGLAGRINSVMQPCFFALADLMPTDEAIAAIRKHIEKTYGKLGEAVVARNLKAVDSALDALAEVKVPDATQGGLRRRPPVPAEAPAFVQRVTAPMLAGEGDLLPVSALPVDGTFPTSTSRWEKRAIASEVPIWDPDICIDCAHCVLVCPHAALRMKVYDPVLLDGAPDGFKSKDFRSAEIEGMTLTIQVAPEDCTGCRICVEVCPAKSKTEAKHKAINMGPALEHTPEERTWFEFFQTIPDLDPGTLDPATIKGSQVRQPLFEFSGACSGCGETPYLKLLTQLFGDRAVIANATGCSSIYGGNLPTTPWAAGADGRGPAWANSLFEDNAEFGLGIRLAIDHQAATARELVRTLAEEIGTDLAEDLLTADQTTEGGIRRQRERVAELRRRLAALDGSAAAGMLTDLAEELVRRSVWIVGGDGWAYDIGYGGLDHVLASGEDVNVLVLDTEVYSNTGGQASKATPRGAIAKFASSGKSTGKKDLGMIAAAYGDVYVAQIALGASYQQTIKAFLEAEAWRGPSLIIAYSTCIAHGIEMATSMGHQKDAVSSGYWPLYRYHPGDEANIRPFKLDSKAPSKKVEDFALAEARFSMLARANPDHAKRLMELAQADVDERRRYYEQLAGVERHAPKGVFEDD